MSGRQQDGSASCFSALIESVEIGQQLEATCYVAIELPVAHRVLLRHQPPELSVQAILRYDAVHLLALVFLLFVCSRSNISMSE